MNAGQYEGEIRLGRAAQAVGQLGRALSHFEVAISLAPEDPQAYLWAGDVRLSAGEHTLAQALANTALALPCAVGQRSFGLQLCALCLLRQYQISVVNQPSIGLRTSAQTRLKRLRLADAAAAAQEAVQNQPNNSGNHHVQAQVLAAMDMPAAAEAAFRQALSLTPERIAVLTGYAGFLKTQWRLAEARETIERAAKIEPGNLGLMLMRGQIAFAQDDLVTARDMALWALSRNATNRQALELLAMVKARRSWLTAPYWWCKAFVPRLTKLHITLLLIGFIALVVAVKLLVPAWIWANLPPANTIKNVVFAGLVLYAVICPLHVMFLVQRERRQVKLKNF